MAEFEILRGLTPPVRRRAGGRHPKYPWRQMEAGDCIVVPAYAKRPSKAQGIVAAQYFVKRHRPDLRAMQEKLDDGTFRIWLLKREKEDGNG